MSALERIRVGSTVRPMPGERVSGDAIVVMPWDDGLLLAIIDVLGHGPEAHAAGLEVVAMLESLAHGGPAQRVATLHRQLSGSRGCALGLCHVRDADGQLDYVGVGNTVIRRFGQEETRLVSFDGVLGQNMRTPRVQSMTLATGDRLLMYTDGVSDRFSLNDYPSLLHHDPDLIARNVVERYGKHYDDAACLALELLA